MNEQKHTFLDYRSPYVWQSRAINFNKQLIKKLNHIHKCNSKPVQPRSKKIGIPQHRNGTFQHRLLEVSASNSSISPSLTSLEDKEEIPFVKGFCQKYGNANKMARNYMDHYNTSRTNHHFMPHGTFSPSGNRCPVHGMSSHLVYKHPGQGHFDSSNRFSSMTDLPEYGMQPSPYMPFPYGYLYSDKQYHAPYPQYYSSHMYMPGSYLPMQYLNANLYSSKHLPPYQQRRNHSFEYNNTMRLYPEEKRSKCKGHLVVLAIILTVITIGVIMGIILAVTIN